MDKTIWSKDTWVKPYLKKYKNLLFLVFFLGVLTIFCAISLMFVAGFLISKSATRPENILLVFVPVVLTRAFGVGRPVFRYLERLNSHNWVLKITSDMRKRLYLTVQKHGMFFKEHYQTGKVLSLLADDIDHLENLYLRTVFPLIIAYIIALLVIVVLGILDIRFALIVAIGFSIVLLIIPLISVLKRGVDKEYKQLFNRKAYTRLADSIMGLRDWMVSGRKEDFIKFATKDDRKLAKLTYNTKKFEWNRDLLVKIILGLIIICTIVWTSQYLSVNKESVNYAAAFVLAMFTLIGVFSPAPQAAEEWPMYRDSVKRLNDISNNNHHVISEKVKGKFLKLSPKNFKDIDMDHVSFKYGSSETPIIKDVSFKAKKGDNIAIIGPSGTGKSTLLELLTGELKPTKGKVSINGESVNNLGIKRSEWISVLNQYPFLFNTSVLNNVRMGNENASDNQVKQAIKEVGLKDYVESLPQKYNTPVEEKGVRFSGGQRQRLALARILLQDNPIVLLDEPTAGLDPITENKLINTLKHVLKNKTVIWVTHHLQGLNNMSRIMFIENGEIKMQGTHKELYANNKRYRELWRLDKGIPSSNNYDKSES